MTVVKFGNGWKQPFIEVPQNFAIKAIYSQENNCVGVSF